MKDASTQTDMDLTSFPETQSAKRRREGEDGDDSVAKRRKAVTPDQPKFLFSKTRNRSLLTSAPPKFGARRESPFYTRVIEPTSPDTTPEHEERRSASRERARPPQTPTPALAPAGILGSVRRIFGYFTGGQGPVQNEAEHQQQQHQHHPSELHSEIIPSEDQDTVEEGSPTPVSRLSEPESAVTDPEILDSRIYNREFFKRRRTANTIAGREQLAAMRNDGDEASTDFHPVGTPGTNKRKLASVDGKIPGPSRGGFGIDDNYLDVENEVEGLEESRPLDTQASTPSTKAPPQTPLRSALRQPGIGFGSVGRSSKSVQINPVSSVRPIYGQYGRSGEYRGSTFSDLSSRSDSSLDVSDMHSPTTLRNTKQNQTPKFRLDPTIIDPNDDDWRPSLANPRPGHFRVPDADEFEDEDEDDGTETITLSKTTGSDEVPPQPSTPRMAHAELPQQPSSNGVSSLNDNNDSVLMNDTQEIRLHKARSEAQRYKPARSSRLSLTEKARSRSSSPPGSEEDARIGSEATLSTATQAPLAAETPAQVSATTSSANPLGREDLDNTIVGDDGMTDYQREHQYDEWADNLNWPAPQTYVESGVASSYIEDMVRKNWTERDTREAIEFWEREFREGLKAAHEAEAQGKVLEWITDPDEILEYEQAAAAASEGQ